MHVRKHAAWRCPIRSLVWAVGFDMKYLNCFFHDVDHCQILA